MAKPLFSNNAGSALASAITSGATTLTVTAGQGGLFPTPSGGDTFTVTLYAVTGVVESAWEVMTCTARSGDVLTVTRGQEGTTAQAWPLGTPVEARLTAGVMTALHAPKTASRALATDASGYVAPSVVTTTELNCLSGITGALQPQLAAKASLSGATFTGVVTVPSLNGGPLAGMRNLLINGDFRIWQRGTAFNNTTGYTADRAKVWPNDGTIVTVKDTGIAPDGVSISSNLKTTVTTQGAGDVLYYFQAIEDVTLLAGKTVTLSAWVYSSIALNGSSIYLYGFMAQNFGSGGSAEVRTAMVPAGIIPASTWTKITLTFSLGSIAAKTVGVGSHTALLLYGKHASGHYITFTQMQLEQGTIATPFEFRPTGVELALCQRYFSVISGVFLNPSKNSDYYFKQTMRAIPTISHITPVNGSGGTLTVLDADRCYQEADHSTTSNFTAWADAEY